jgi:mxaJ protein
MSSRFRTSLVALSALIVMGAAPSARELAICVEPDNLPFSNRAGEGIEPAIARVLAAQLHARLIIVPVAQTGRGYVRSTLGRGRCDAIMSMPPGSEGATMTEPYYRAGWFFVGLAERSFDVRSFDDPILRRLKIGVPSVGEGYDTPPLAALGRRGIAENLHLYGVSGLGSAKRFPAQMIDDLEAGRIDLAVLWGPTAGYYAVRAKRPISIIGTPASDGVDIPLTTAIAIGVAPGNTELRDLLNAALAERRQEIAAILASYHVPLIEP